MDGGAARKPHIFIHMSKGLVFRNQKQPRNAGLLKALLRFRHQAAA